jgi:hypothetical protein
MSADFGFVQAATLTLLGLITGFSFSIATGRFFKRIGFDHRPHASQLGKNASYPRESVGIPRRPSSLIFSHHRFSAKIADQVERNSERDNVLEEKQAEIVHVMDAVNHDGVIRSRDQHGACGEEHAD